MPSAFIAKLKNILNRPVYFGKSLSHVPAGAIVFCANQPAMLNCGLAGIITVKKAAPFTAKFGIQDIPPILADIYAHSLETCQNQKQDIAVGYLGGDEAVAGFLNRAKLLKRQPSFYGILHSEPDFKLLLQIVTELKGFVEKEALDASAQAGLLDTASAAVIDQRLETLKDALWTL